MLESQKEVERKVEGSCLKGDVAFLSSSALKLFIFKCVFFLLVGLKSFLMWQILIDCSGHFSSEILASCLFKNFEEAQELPQLRVFQKIGAETEHFLTQQMTIQIQDEWK